MKVDSIREISGIDDILVYKRNGSVTDYQIVCATGSFSLL